jgi:tetratricopeptide (TPR) repeat protein
MARTTHFRFPIATLIVASTMQFANLACANDAEIVSLVGKGDARESATADWKMAAVKQKVAAGWFVRTREMSQMSLLLRDNTQVRLNQSSILNIKRVGEPTTQLELPRGRAWSQAKQSGPDVAAEKSPSRASAGALRTITGALRQRAPIVEVSTPAVTAGIRGTDWEIVVDEDGTTTVTVLSGEVEVYNEQGRVSVLPNEQARAAPGKAPVKSLLSNAPDRVQWVTAYRPQPRRWVKDYSGGFEQVAKDIEAEEYQRALDALAKLPDTPRAILLLADMHLFQGQAADAIKLLEPLAASGNGDAMAVALLSRSYMIAGRIDDAVRLLAQAVKTHPNHTEVLLARVELARLQGDADEARGVARRVIEIDAKIAEAWYQIGRIETEREYAAAAREALQKALALRSDGPGYRGELATLETFANEFRQADEAFKLALEQHPDDYVALTGLGVLQLKRGDPEAALQSFLKAGVIEPRYSRAALFIGVAYYQLGEHARAVELLQKASSLDDKDPLPHLMRSLIYYDALDLGRAIEASRDAQARMPYLKSVNQVLTDQKGNANVGSALAAFGMEEWAQSYAYDSYSPYWAGSHLFLSDRFSGTYNKNSELYKGFLSDPSVFGASNRFSSLVPVPGIYGSVEANVKRDYFTEYGISGAVNGYSVSRVPFSYAFAADRTTGDSRINSTSADGRLNARSENYILGVGVKPTHELGIFGFANSTTYNGRFAERTTGLINNPFDIHFRRYDVGLNYKFSPTNHIWLKIGEGSEKQTMSGALEIANQGNNTIRPGGRLNSFAPDQSQRDIQARHTFDATSSWQVSWGIEHATEGKPFLIDYQIPLIFQNNPNVTGIRIREMHDNHSTAGSLYISNRFALSRDIDAQVDLFYQDIKTSFTSDRTRQFVSLAPVQTFDSGQNRDRELNPRIGFKWRPVPGHVLRLAAQIWRKPPGVNTLAPVDTVGIPIDDEIEAAGGRLKRARLQHEIQLSSTTFAQWFVDYKEVNNPTAGGADIISDFQVVDLERLRSRKRVYAVRQEYLEAKPEFGKGRVEQIGMAVNHLLSRNVSATARYIHTDTRNTTAAFSGRELPFHPKHYLNLGLNWQPYARWIFGATTTYRSNRFRDEANAEPLTAGWAFGLNGYWESEDKRLSVGLVVDQLHSDKKSSIYRFSTATLQGIYRF